MFEGKVEKKVVILKGVWETWRPI